MAKDKITEYDATANNNTVCGDVNIAENSALPSDMNNFAREIMSHLKEGLGSGTPLYVDQTNNRVGINKTPTVALDVSGDADLSGTLDVAGDLTVDTSTLKVDSTNNRVGINTTGSVRDLQIGDNTRSASILSLQTNSSGNGSIYFGDNTTTNAEYAGMIRYSHSDNAMLFWTSSTERMRIDSSGNVGIGNSASGFNAGANNLVVGTGSGSEGITIYADNSSNSAVFFADPDSVTTGQINYQHASNAFTFHTNGGTERMRITSGGNVGIGTDSPSQKLDVNGTIVASTTSSQGARIERNGTTGGANFDSVLASGSLHFRTGATERMRIDSSGNLLVGKTSASLSTTGFYTLAGGATGITRSASTPMAINRLSDNGGILEFYKDNTIVGSIGVAGGSSNELYLYSQKGFVLNSNGIIPSNSTGGGSDNTTDLGQSDVRFDDIYATNGTIQTSDQNEKNTITDSDLGIDFIKRLTPKSYIFNGKTRTHYGLIAQDVETVLTDINKPTSGFAGFIKDDISEEQDGSEYRYGLRYTEFVSPLIQAVKDQQATIDALTARITALENGE